MNQTSLPPAPRTFSSPGVVEWAKFSSLGPKFSHTSKLTGRRAQGVRYERKVQEMLSFIWGSMYITNPWIHFRGSRGPHWCQPDGIYFDFIRGLILIVEVKYQHTSDAWWQMRKLYEPVLSWMFPEILWDFRHLEIVKWYDPNTPWPEPIALVSEPQKAFNLPYGTTGVHIWKPSRI